MTGTVDEEGVWTADVVVTRQAPDSNGAQAVYTPDITVDGAPASVPSFRVTTKAAAEPTPTSTASAEPIPTASATSAAPADPSAPAASTTTAASAASDPGRKGPGAGGSHLANTGAQTAGALGAALVLVGAGAGALALRRARRA